MCSSLRVYTNPDVVGCEIGGAVKNVIALAAGMTVGLGFGGNTLAALLTRGLAELTRLGVALGGQPLTFLGLAGIGDLVVTCNSPASRNHHVGEQLGRGRPLDAILSEMTSVAEGVRSCGPVLALGREAGWSSRSANRSVTCSRGGAGRRRQSMRSSAGRRAPSSTASRDRHARRHRHGRGGDLRHGRRGDRHRVGARGGVDRSLRRLSHRARTGTPPIRLGRLPASRRWPGPGRWCGGVPALARHRAPARRSGRPDRRRTRRGAWPTARTSCSSPRSSDPGSGPFRDPWRSSVSCGRCGRRTGIVTASRNADRILAAAGVDDLFDVQVDGTVAEAEGLAGKPDPATFLAAARRLDADPVRSVVIEDALAGSGGRAAGRVRARGGRRPGRSGGRPARGRS